MMSPQYRHSPATKSSSSSWNKSKWGYRLFHTSKHENSIWVILSSIKLLSPFCQNRNELEWKRNDTHTYDYYTNM